MLPPMSCTPRYGAPSDKCVHQTYPTQVFEEYQNFIDKYGDLSVVPTRYFLSRPDIGEEMHIEIEKGKTLIIRLMAVGPVVEGRAQRDVWFEVNGEVRVPLHLIRAYLISAS
jgi:pyruvate carboxylase